MCFKNLPIEIDDAGRMTLRDEASRAFAVSTVPASSGPKPLSEKAIKELLARNGYIRDVDFDRPAAGIHQERRLGGQCVPAPQEKEKDECDPHDPILRAPFLRGDGDWRGAQSA